MFLELGYELFQNKGSLKVHFLEGDVFENDAEAEGGKELEKFDGKIDMIDAASFLHLFTWEDQVWVGDTDGPLDDKDSLVFGRQVGTANPGVHVGWSDQTRTRHKHDLNSFQKLWDAIGKKTGKKWKATSELLNVKVWYREEHDEPSTMNFRVMQFEVHRLE